ncbi:hypothetical protein WH47_12561 [Habropoda laboriosa]|uniref:Uncharacterized protein n=1 Tax=Habropoda laboriosa TaxID=597456 RepID=A0A0L7QL49_9HYME|nr:hypothetical protein WH47_12561 [Habropoda laboriosa]
MVVTVLPGGKRKVAEVISDAKSKIKLSDLGISTIGPRRAITGAMILEIPGEGGAAKADALAAKMAEIVGGDDIKIARPQKKVEVRISGLDDSVTTPEVVTAVALAGECLGAEVMVGEIRFYPYRMGACWARCPLVAARKVVTSGRLQVGWSSARVEPANTVAGNPPTPMETDVAVDTTPKVITGGEEPTEKAAPSECCK